MIKIRNLHKSFGGLEVLKGIDLEIKKGEIVNSGSVNELLEEYCQPSLEDVYLDLFGDDEDVTVD